ncbi:MAG TPA: hypothetical protein EYP86_04940 [Candidatus Altiarchaeales archaeon]|nr:hypothetical protein [Candidatus Altiarchaeales archaeon]
MKMFTKKEKDKLKKLNRKSLSVINSVYLDNGGILASPPSGRYPYIYPRDAALILRILNNLGKHRMVKKSLKFLVDKQMEIGEWTQRYNRDGTPASYRPSQLDCNGLVLYVLNEYYQKTGDKKFIEFAWNSIKQGIEFIKEHYIHEERLLFSLNSIHEWPPMESGFDIWVNVTCHAGIKAGESMAEELGEKDYTEEWENLASDLWIGISKRLIVDNKFIKVTNSHSIMDPDISEMAPYITKSVSVRETILKNSVKSIEKILWDDELTGINRYLEKHGEAGRNNGGYGPYSMYTGWMAQYYIDLGKYDKSEKYIRWFLRYNRNFLIPEHVSTKERFLKWKKRAIEVGRYSHVGRKEEAERVMKSEEYKKGLVYWVVPLTWSHAEFMNIYNKLKENNMLD